MTSPVPSAGEELPPRRSDWPFYLSFGLLGGSYVLLIVAMLLAEASWTSPESLLKTIMSREIQYAVKLSLISCSITAILSLWVAVPLGYLLSRHSFRGKAVLDALLDIPVVLPPLVIGLCLLILMQTWPGRLIEKRLGFQITYEIPAVILAQFAVSAAFAVRTMRVTFDQISLRQEQVALTLGCSRSQAFWWVVLPQARRGLISAGTLAWARALGEFGPVVVFASATRMHTEVLPTSVFLELSIANLAGAVAVSFLMVLTALAILVVIRIWGLRESLP